MKTVLTFFANKDIFHKKDKEKQNLSAKGNFRSMKYSNKQTKTLLRIVQV